MGIVVQTCMSLQLRQLKTLQSQSCLSGQRCKGTEPSFVNLTRYTATPSSSCRQCCAHSVCVQCVAVLEQYMELVCCICRQRTLTGSVVETEALDPYEQPPLCLSDFRAALEEYEPTLHKAAQHNATAAMPVASMMASFAELLGANNSNNGSHDDNKEPRID